MNSFVRHVANRSDDAASSPSEMPLINPEKMLSVKSVEDETTINILFRRFHSDAITLMAPVLTSQVYIGATNC